MRYLRSLRPVAFVYLSALITVVGSERIFWYYTDADLASFIELGLFYALGMYALLWVMERYRTTSFWSFFVAVPVFGYVIEGVITPVLYEGGPSPFFPAYFTGWHGLLSVVTLWYGLRRWLIADRWRAVLVAALLLGVVWGLQATTMTLPANLDDPGLAESTPAVRSPLDFLGYAGRTTAVLIGGHWLLGRGIWVRELGRSRIAEGLALFVIGAVLIGWTVVIPWAGPMFVVLIGGVAWVLRRHRRIASGPSVLEQLDGRVSPRALAMLVMLPLTAAAVYGGLYELAPSETAVSVINYSIIGVATMVAAVLMVVSWVKVLRRLKHPPVPVVRELSIASSSTSFGAT